MPDEVERCVHGLANCPPCARDREPRWLPVFDDDGVAVAMEWYPGAALPKEEAGDGR